MKKLGFILLPVLMVLVFSLSAWSLDTEMTATVRVKDMFGLNGLAGNNLTGLNPATVEMLDLTPSRGFAALSYGSADFQSAPAFNIISALVWHRFGHNQALRISQYTAVSDTGSIKAFDPDVAAKFTTHSTDISYGWRFAPDWYAGVAVAPETINGTFRSDDGIARAKVTPSWNIRLGICKANYGFFPLHLVYTSDEFKAEQTVLGIHSSGHYRQRSLTAGVSVFGILTLAHQFESFKGPGINQSRSLRSVGLTLPLSSPSSYASTYFDWSYADHGSNYSLTRNSPKWYMGLAVSNNGYRRNRDAFGTATTFTCWAGRWL